MKFSASLAVFSAAIVLGAPTGEFHHPEPLHIPSDRPEQNSTSTSSSCSSYAPVEPAYASSSSLVPETTYAPTTLATATAYAASSLVPETTAYAPTVTGYADTTSLVPDTTDAPTATGTDAIPSSIPTGVPTNGTTTSTGNPVGALFCNGHSFTGTCTHQTANPGQCVTLTPDVKNLAASAGPDKGSFCYFFTGEECNQGEDFFHVAYPGVNDLSKTPVNGPPDVTRSFEKKLASFFCVYQ